MHQWILTFTCTDRPGIVNAVSGGIVQAGGNIIELQQFSSTDTGRFFMRVQVACEMGRTDFGTIMAGVAVPYRAVWELEHLEHPVRTLILASKSGHCVNDLLYHQRSGLLPIEVPLILANHDDLRPLADFYGVGLESHVVLPETKPAFEDRIRQVVSEHDIELVVLARSMQILSPGLCTELAGRAINIHHSFLPGFKGANPYRQAHARGVKLIGATAHFVTSDLDEGPIIEQNVTRVEHSKSVRHLVQIGQGLESATLTEAVRLFAERRIFQDEGRTVIFR